MSKLQKYVFKRFLFFLFIFTLASMFIFVVVNFFENIDKFVKKATIGVIIKYYFLQLGYIFNFMYPISHLLAAFLSITELALKNELLAIRAAGISLRKVFFPLVVFGLFSSFLDLYITQRLAYQGFRKAQILLRVKILKLSPIFGRTTARNLSFFWKDKLYFFGYISKYTNTGSDISVMEFKGDTIIKRIDARFGRYNGKYWILSDGTLRIIGEPKDSVIFFKKREFKELDVSPFEFLKARSQVIYMPPEELREVMEKKKIAGLPYSAEYTEYLARFSFPFSCFIILFFSIPLAASMRGRAKSTAFGIGLSVAFLYWGTYQSIKLAGMLGKIPPWFGAWGANILFFFPSLWLYLRMEHRGLFV